VAIRRSDGSIVTEFLNVQAKPGRIYFPCLRATLRPITRECPLTDIALNAGATPAAVTPPRPATGRPFVLLKREPQVYA